MANELDFIVNLLVNDGATGPITRLPVEVQAAVREVNAVLSQGFGHVRGLEQFQQQLHAGTADAAQLARAIETLDRAVGTAFNVPGSFGGKLKERLELLQEKAILLQETLSRGVPVNPLGNSPHLNQASQELERVLAAARASDAAAIAGANSGSFASVLSKHNVTDDLSGRLALDRLRFQKAQLAEAGGLIPRDDKTRLAENAEQVKALSQEIQLLARATRLARTEAEGLSRAGTLLGGQTVARVRSSADPRQELLKIRAEQAQSETDSLAAQGASHSQVEAALRREIALNEQLLRQETQRVREQQRIASEAHKVTEAQRLGGGGGHLLNSLIRPEGGFGSAFSRGFFGRNETDKPLAEQLGQAAKFSILYGAAYFALFQFTQALKEAFQGAIEFEQSLVELAFATGRATGEVRGLAEDAAKQAAGAGIAPELGPKLVAQAVGVFGLADASKREQEQALIATEVAARLSRVSGGKDDPAAILERLGGVARSFDISIQGLARIGDSASFVSHQTGTQPVDLIQAAAQIGGLAKNAGFTLEETLAAIGEVKVATGKPAQTVASNLGQIFSRADQGALEDLLRNAGINTIGTTLKEQIKELSTKGLDLSQENQIAAGFGRGAAGEALIKLVKGFDQVEVNAKKAGESTGFLSKAFEAFQETAGGRLAIFLQSVKLLFIELGKTGLLDLLVALLVAAQPLVSGLTEILSALNDLTAQGGTAARIIRDLALAVVALGIASRVAGASVAAGAALAGGGIGSAAATGLGARLALGGGVLGALAKTPLGVGAGIFAVGTAIGVARRWDDVDRSINDRPDSSLPVDEQIAQLERQRAEVANAGFIDQTTLGVRGIGDLFQGKGFGEDDRDAAKKQMDEINRLRALRAEELEILQGKKGDRGALFKEQPSVVATSVDDSVSNFARLSQEAQARGDSPADIVRLKLQAARDLTTIRDQAKESGADLDPATLHKLNQAIAEAGKDAFDALEARVDQLVNLAGQGKTAEQRDNIEQEARRLLTLANGLRVENLPTKIASLDQLQKAIDAGYKNQVEQNRALIRNQIQLTKAKIEFFRLQQADADDLYQLLVAGPLPGVTEAEIKRLNKVLVDLNKKLKAPGKGSGGKLDATYDGTDKGGAADEPQDTAAQIAAAKNAANAFPSSRVEAAAAAIKTAAADLDAQKRGTVAYYNALRSLRQAQYEYTQTVLEAQHISRQLTIDLTNPLAVAREELRTAQAKLRSDLAKGAPADVINQDKVAVQNAANQAEATKFQQQLSQVQTNYDLGRITTAQYLRYLDSQADALRKIAHRTYQQQQELNQLDKLIQEVQKSLQGQFNLGDIKLPSVLQVRQQVLGGAGAQVANIQNVRIDISGGDIAVIKSVLSQYLGPGAFSNSAISPPKL